MSETTNQQAVVVPPIQPSWTQIVPAIVAVIGLFLTIVGSSATVLSKVELLRSDIEQVKQSVNVSDLRQQKELDDHEARLRDMEREIASLRKER